MRAGTILRTGQSGDFLFIDSLRKKEGNALGFLPKETYESVLARQTRGDGKYARDRWKTQEIYITEDNNDTTGYCYVSYAGSFAKVFQIVVRQDARRWHRALMMIDKIEEKARIYGKHGIEARVAYDLESNDFWKAIGYTPVITITSTWLNQRESKSKRPLVLYKKYLDRLCLCEHPAEQAGQNSEDV